MKKYIIYLSSFLLLLSFSACDKEDNPVTTGNNSNLNESLLNQQVNDLPKEPLSQDETESILFMREEEKMARDAYLNFFQLWGNKIFQNISNSEQTHMDAILQLINKYALADPAANKPVGSFANSDIQALYNALYVQGKISGTEALKAGAAIEETDIRDLQNILKDDDVNNQDLELVYTNLLKGSRNHLRSFVKQLNGLGITYVPLYLSQAEFDAIVNSPMESGL